LLVITDLPGVLLAPVCSRRTGHLVTADVGEPTAEDLAHLVDLAEAGRYRTVRDRTYDCANASWRPATAPPSRSPGEMAPAAR
jgi:hypothetical protein